MKILFFLNNVWPPAIKVTGLSSLYETAKCLSSAGNEVHILTSTGVWEKGLSGSRYYNTSQIKKWHEEQSTKYGLIFHTYSLGFLGRFPKAFFILNRIIPIYVVPVLVKKFGIQVVQEFTGTPFLIYRSLLIEKLTGAKVFHTLIGEVPGFVGTHKWLAILRPKVTKIITANNRIKRNLLGIGYKDSDVDVLPLSVEGEAFAAKKLGDDEKKARLRRRYGLEVEDFCFLFLGPLDYHKGFDLFARAGVFYLEKEKNPNAKFIIATYSSGSENNYNEKKEILEKIIKSHRNNFVILEGVHDTVEIYSLSDAVVIPQTEIGGATGYPVTMMEAMFAGKPVIASKIPGIDEIIMNGKTGYLFYNNSTFDLARTFKRLISGGEKIVVEQAKEVAKKLFDVNKNTKKLENIYSNALGSKINNNISYTSIVTMLRKGDRPGVLIDAYKFAVFLMQNRLLYWFSKNYYSEVGDPELVDFFEWIKNRGDAVVEIQKKTLRKISDISGEFGLDYMIAKLGRNFDYISSDIDLVVRQKDMESWISIFEKMDFKVEKHTEFMGNKVYQRTVSHPDYTKIDLTSQFCWQGNLYFSKELIWQRHGAIGKELSIEADFLINFCTVIFKKYYYGYLDFDYLNYLYSKKLDSVLIKKQSKKYNWGRTFDRNMEFFNQIRDTGREMPVVMSFDFVLANFKDALFSGRFSINSFLYFILSRLRYKLVDYRLVPGHVWWIETKEFEPLRGRKFLL